MKTYIQMLRESARSYPGKACVMILTSLFLIYVFGFDDNMFSKDRFLILYLLGMALAIPLIAAMDWYYQE